MRASRRLKISILTLLLLLPGMAEAHAGVVRLAEELRQRG